VGERSQPRPQGARRDGPAEQLCETTLDPEVRSLYHVKVEHADAADEIFATLMRDVVDPCREFIQTDALRWVNLGV
jgi:DNA gyrase subunit B